MQEPRIRAEGTNGVIELLQDSVLLQHKGRFGQQGEATKEIPIIYGAIHIRAKEAVQDPNKRPRTTNSRKRASG